MISELRLNDEKEVVRWRLLAWGMWSVLGEVKWSDSVVSDSLRPMDCSLPGFSVHGISQARILEWGAISFSRGSSRPRDWTRVSCIVSGRFTSEPPGQSVMFWVEGTKTGTAWRRRMSGRPQDICYGWNIGVKGEWWERRKIVKQTWVHKLALGAKVGNRLLTYKPERDMEWFLGGERHNQTFQRLTFEKHFKEIPLLVALEWGVSLQLSKPDKRETIRRQKIGGEWRHIHAWPCTWNYHNTVNWLYSNIKLIVKIFLKIREKRDEQDRYLREINMGD